MAKNKVTYNKTELLPTLEAFAIQTLEGVTCSASQASIQRGAVGGNEIGRTPSLARFGTLATFQRLLLAPCLPGQMTRHAEEEVIRPVGGIEAGRAGPLVLAVHKDGEVAVPVQSGPPKEQPKVLVEVVVDVPLRTSNGPNMLPLHRSSSPSDPKTEVRALWASFCWSH